MKNNLLSLAGFLCLLLTSCSKSVSTQAGNTDSSLVQLISVNQDNDSVTSNYLFDNEDYLIKQWTDASNYQVAYPLVEYTRDEEKRPIKITSFGLQDTTITNVHYASGNEVAYAIDYDARFVSKIIDSITFEYANGEVEKINIFLPGLSEQPVYYYTYKYANSNVSEIRRFSLNNDETYSDNIGYDLEYDDKVNPLFTHDDINILYDWNYASTNNIIRQTNHYGNSGAPDDYVIYEYIYGSDNKPISVTWSGPGISTMKGFYFYK